MDSLILIMFIFMLVSFGAAIAFYPGFKFYRFHKLHSPDLTYTLQIHPTPKFKYISDSTKRILENSASGYTIDPFIPLNTAVDHHKSRIESIYLGNITSLTTMEVEFKTSSGQSLWLEQHLLPYHNWRGKLKGYNAIARNITEKKELEHRLQWLSHHDDLTGVYNRNYLEQILQSPHHLSFPMTVLLCDFDNMKVFNDEYGHDQGDYILRSFTRITHEYLGESAQIYRYGGDEFVIFIPGTFFDGEMDEVIAGIQKPLASIVVENHRLSVSIGYSFVYNEIDLRHAIKFADQRMYQQKKQHHETIVTTSRI
ncbi:diguanylate cyclase [Thalassobacillus sp. CUG 92003]|uniref:sensor domain-containing diguanylate cyclase n=1 Tax=Thalassobacillus sp. CUG 92003 TaxID=2736641 RepID=UPI0015E6A13B|nr:diguanylate cyclase [Thalassobacillus sp. CUG 92003]